MVDLLEARRRILLNTPHLESLSGATASFETDMSAKLKECKVHFTPVQEGTGDPSPENVRPIHGWDSITIYNGQTAVATIPFPQTIYGGYVDLVKGEVVEEWKEYVYPSKTNLFTDRGNGYYEVGFGDVNGKGYGSANNSMCSKLSYGFRITSKIGYELNYVLLGKSNRFHTLVYSDTPMTNETARQWFIDNNIQLVRLVYTPTIYSIDPITLRTLRGQNNIWSDANGNIELKFWTH